MKKIFAIALAVVMVLSIASVAGAFNWAKPADSTTADNFGYYIDVIKFTRSTGELGSSYFNADDAATAVNGADVYYAIKLVVDGPSNSIKENAKADVTFTALEGTATRAEIDLSKLDDGVYYYAADTATKFKPITYFVENNLAMNYTAETPVYASRCLDTATAKVSAKVYADRPFGTVFNAGNYDVLINTAATQVTFLEANSRGATASVIAVFTLNGDGLVTGVTLGAKGTSTNIIELYRWLNNGDADSIEDAIANKEMYMTKANLRAAFGFSYSQSDSITWNANSTPIILDPTVSIPKTGDNASVIGFAMIMVAVVAAAVAVRKVNA